MDPSGIVCRMRPILSAFAAFPSRKKAGASSLGGMASKVARSPWAATERWSGIHLPTGPYVRSKRVYSSLFGMRLYIGEPLESAYL